MSKRKSINMLTKDLLIKAIQSESKSSRCFVVMDGHTAEIEAVVSSGKILGEKSVPARIWLIAGREGEYALPTFVCRRAKLVALQRNRRGGK